MYDVGCEVVADRCSPAVEQAIAVKVVADRLRVLCTPRSLVPLLQLRVPLRQRHCHLMCSDEDSQVLQVAALELVLAEDCLDTRAFGLAGSDSGRRQDTACCLSLLHLSSTGQVQTE